MMISMNHKELVQEVAELREEMETLKESIEWTQNPKLVQRLKQSEEDVKAGRLIPLDEL